MITVVETRDIAACRALRRVVFIEEQGVSEADELDDLDDSALHLLATDDGTAVGTARLLTFGNAGKIGRVCVLHHMRGRGIGAALTRAAIGAFAGMDGVEKVKLSAQISALVFYEKLGFTAHGPVYIDAGIDHRDMMLLLPSRA
jgi:predicted GNAT family N-acyltransferase